jgi:hypothetical protein
VGEHQSPWGGIGCSTQLNTKRTHGIPQSYPSLAEGADGAGAYDRGPGHVVAARSTRCAIARRVLRLGLRRDALGNRALAVGFQGAYMPCGTHFAGY